MTTLPLIRAKYVYLDGRSRWGHTKHLADGDGQPLCHAHKFFTHRDRCGWEEAEGEPVCSTCLKAWKISHGIEVRKMKNLQHYNPTYGTSSHVIHVAGDDQQPLCGATKTSTAEWRPTAAKPSCQLCIKRSRNVALFNITPRTQLKLLGTAPGEK